RPGIAGDGRLTVLPAISGSFSVLYTEPGGQPMHTTTGKKLLTSAEYIHLIEQGVLTETDRVELIEGEVVEKMTVGNRHVGSVSRLIHLFVGRFGDRVMVSAQSPVLLTAVSMPEPDLVVLHARDDFYEGSYAAPQD